MGTANNHILLNDYLEALGVPHTEEYTEQRVNKMPFQTLFGMTKLMEEYGVKSEGYFLNDKDEIALVTPPFLANTPMGFVIVTGITGDKISYKTEGVNETAPINEFKEAWDGNILISYPAPNAKEPDYSLHARIEFFMHMKKWILAFCCAILLIYLFIANGLYNKVSTYFIVAIDIAGLYFTYLLVQKSLKIHNKAADKVCKVLQEGGCDSILEMNASKFFGLFGWSEVGFSYFSVSLLTLLLLPDMLPWLALCNLCCLPFTFWSIWYQKFRAHHWCTLCVCVQASLWLLFFNYLSGGWLKNIFPLSLNFFALGIAYIAVMLGINALMPLMQNKNTDDNGQN